MSRFDPLVSGSIRESVSETGTGDGLLAFSLSQQINSEGKERGELIRGNRRKQFSPSPVPSPSDADLADFKAFIDDLTGWRSEPDRSDLARFLRANPGMTVRDWKGKGPSTPLDAERWEKPWNRLKSAEVRAEAVLWFARELPRNLRQAAARDPGLIWNTMARKYRLRLPTDPAPGPKC